MPTNRLEKPGAPGGLRQAAANRSAHALGSGALQPISTTVCRASQSGVDCVVRVLAGQATERELKGLDRVVYPKTNPFLPYDLDLFVADLSPTHLCLLNKFTVLTDHLLIVTREFEHQETCLTLEDFEALWICMREFDGLGFYNGGINAGASQPHKHLQYVPFPLGSSGSDIPIESVMPTEPTGLITTVGSLPFAHAFLRFAGRDQGGAAVGARCALDAYAAMLAFVGLDREGSYPEGANIEGRRVGAYNLLVTRRWMLLVPRSRASIDGISVNALGFAGHLLARNQDQLYTIRKQGPLDLLQRVGMPR